MSKNFRVTLNEGLKDENFKSEYDALEPEYHSKTTLRSHGNCTGRYK